MYMMFWFYIIIVLIILWFLLAFMFKPIGKFIYRIWKDAINNMKK